jgi:hypothetical protein
MKQYRIFAGLGGSFGGAQEQGVLTFSDEDEAISAAYQEACQIYESYEGLHGLRTVREIMEEEECSMEFAEDIYYEERQNWLNYYVELV